jgi:protein FRA10AC1
MAVGGNKKDYDDLDSEFDSSEKDKRLSWRDDPLSAAKSSQFSTGPSHSTGLPSKQVLVDERDKEEWRSRRYHYLSMDAYTRHKILMNRYMSITGKTIEQFKRSTENDRNDYDVLRDEHRFIWDKQVASTWEEKLAKTYYDKLFKEYAISDLSLYKENKVALRWRVEKEVVEGKGQFICGNKKCGEREGLNSWEVNFGYVEKGEKKNALVKLRLCPRCSKKLNYHHKRKLWKKEKRKNKSNKKKSKKAKIAKDSSSDSSKSDTEEEEDKGNDDKVKFHDRSNHFCLLFGFNCVLLPPLLFVYWLCNCVF